LIDTAPSARTRPSLLARVRLRNNNADWAEFLELYYPLIAGWCRTWDRAAQEADVNDLVGEVQVLRHDDTIADATFSPDGRLVASASSDGTAMVWNTTTGRGVAGPLKHSGSIHSISFAPNGDRVLTASEDRTARVWDVATGKPITPPLIHSYPVRHASWSRDGTKIATASVDFRAERNEIRIFDATSGKQIGLDRLIEAEPTRESLWCKKAIALAHCGRHFEAADMAAKLYDRVEKDPNMLYDIACCYALCVTGVAKDKPEPSVEEEAQCRSYADAAITMLRAAVVAGYEDVTRLDTNPDLASIHENVDYKELIEQLKSRSAP
jgi:hypothetical protein